MAFSDFSTHLKVYEWLGRFNSDRTLTPESDHSRTERLTISITDETKEKIVALLNTNCRVTFPEIAKNVGISFKSCQAIVHNLGYQRIASQFVPCILTEEQKTHRREIAEDLLQRAETDKYFLKSIIISDKIWIYDHDVEINQQSSQRVTEEPRPKKMRMSQSNVRAMLIIFFDYFGVVHQEFVPRGTTVNAAFYRDVLQRLWEKVQRQRPNLWKGQVWLLHHNTQLHTALLIQEFLALNSIPVISQPSYSPDLSPANFFLFPRLRWMLKGQQFKTRTEIETKSLEALYTIPISAFQAAFKDWKKRFKKCIKVEGAYFETPFKYF